MRYLERVLLIALVALPLGHARAHFKLLAPDSWVTEDNLGGPQKGGPCGPGGSDDAGPAMSMKVTTVHAGDTVMVKIQETIHHPGWFRVSLSEKADDFKDPEFSNVDCTYDMSKVPTGPHDNVLMDGFAMDTQGLANNRNIMQEVKIPDKPCDDCTLQVIQVMADSAHMPPGCVYHHCAKLKILAAESSAAAAGAGGSAAGSAGSSSSAGSSASPGSAAGASASAAGGGGAGGQSASAAAGKSAAATGGAGASAAAHGGAGSSTTAGASAGRASGATAAPSTGSMTTAAASKPATSTQAGTSGATPAATAPAPAAESGGCSTIHLAGGAPDTWLIVAGFGLALAARRRRSA